MAYYSRLVGLLHDWAQVQFLLRLAAKGIPFYDGIQIPLHPTKANFNNSNQKERYFLILTTILFLFHRALERSHSTAVLRCNRTIQTPVKIERIFCRNCLWAGEILGYQILHFIYHSAECFNRSHRNFKISSQK